MLLQNYFFSDPKSLAMNLMQSLGQKPLTYNRQVMSIVSNPTLLDIPAVKESFPADVIARAEGYIARMGGGIGAYSNSQGIEIFREEVAEVRKLSSRSCTCAL
eukprot:SAG31_NODE_688_length_12807_cov_6.395814_4_plen_103_part_00